MTFHTTFKVDGKNQTMLKFMTLHDFTDNLPYNKMWVKWVSGMWNLFTIYGKNEMWLLFWDELKWQNVALIMGQRGKYN